MVSATCPTCLAALSDERRLCGRCRTPYHPRCFDESRCLVTGCEPAGAAPVPAGLLWLGADMAWIGFMSVEMFAICGAGWRDNLPHEIRDELLVVGSVAVGLSAAAALFDLARGRGLTSPSRWGWLLMGLATLIAETVNGPSSLGGLAGPLVYSGLWACALLALLSLACDGGRDRLRVLVVAFIALPAFVYTLAI